MEQIQYTHFKIIKLTKIHLDQLQRIHQECLPNVYYSRETYLSFLANKIYQSHAIINETNEIQSFIVLMINADEADIISIGTQLKKRRTGVATSLLQSCEQTYNLKKIFLEVSCQNIEAIQFYQYQGFEIINVRKAYIKADNGKMVDAYVMVKNVPRGTFCC